jgi:hypothetical protein
VQEEKKDKTDTREKKIFKRIYSNSAKFLKIGQSLWVDHVFSNGVLDGIYSFHASASAYTEYWNNTFWKGTSTNSNKLSCCQVWDVFVQESIWTIAEAFNRTLELQDGLSINELTKEAFQALSENGIITAADQHACNECTQKYKKSADFITEDDPSAVAGIDHQRSVPISGGDRLTQTPGPEQQAIPSSDSSMDVDCAPVKMVVLDGLVVGPAHCAFDD